MLQPRSSALTEDSNGNRNGRDIYATMRQSSGSNFFLNRKDTIIIKGYLNKKSESVVCAFSLIESRVFLLRIQLENENEVQP